MGEASLENLKTLVSQSASPGSGGTKTALPTSSRPISIANKESSMPSEDASVWELHFKFVDLQFGRKSVIQNYG